ncbi:MAG TPA: ANTAR domain-containing protein [Variovorax sp.]|nr:ANTAR domain-containing protein [Variovorax sp.]
MSPILLVLSSEDSASPCHAAVQHALASGEVALVGQATCSMMVQAAAEHAPQHVLLCVRGFTAEVRDALRAWEGAPPCAVSLLCAPLGALEQAELVELGVHAWVPLNDELTPPDLLALLAQAQARWRREAGLRTELADLRTRLDERKWIDRAKGLLMSARGIGEDEAFGLLRGAAMHANLRLGEVSRSVLEAAQWAEAINRAGQLRMLSQRLTLLAAQALAEVDARRSRVLRKEAGARVQGNLDYLGALSLGQAAAQAFAQVRTAWQALDAALAQRLVPEVLAQIDQRAESLLTAAEAMTTALEASGERRALRIVNLCGRQRMRAQRLAKDALLASILVQREAQARLLPTMKEFEAALLELEQAPLSSSEIRAGLANARDEWLRLVGGVRNADSPEGRLALVRASEALVQSFDALTAAYEHSLQVIMS